jgi:hypothetical protein
MIELSDVLTILAVVLGITGSIWGSIRWLISSTEKNIKDLRDSMQSAISSQGEDIGNLHERINEVKDHYVKRVDLDRDLTNIYGMLNSIKDDIRGQTDAMNQRLDRLINVFVEKDRSN